MIRRILTGQKTKDNREEEWLRTNIFHTCVEHQGKALNLIIDNGSGMNVISQEVVEKMKFLQKKHPKPYKLSVYLVTRKAKTPSVGSKAHGQDEMHASSLL